MSDESERDGDSYAHAAPTDSGSGGIWPRPANLYPSQRVSSKSSDIGYELGGVPGRTRRLQGPQSAPRTRHHGQTVTSAFTGWKP